MNIKQEIKKKLPINFKIFLKEILQFIYSYLIFIFFWINPKYIYLLSKEKYTVPKKYRWKKKINYLEDWILLKNSNQVFPEANIIFRGKSLKFYKNNINYDIPTFFVNFENEKIENKPNFFGLTCKSPNHYKEKDLGNYFKICSGTISQNGQVQWNNLENNYKKNDSNEFKKISEIIKDNGVAHRSNYDNLNLDFGSGLISIILVSSFFNKINIYGWDYYLNQEIGEMSTKKILKILFSRNSLPFLDKKRNNYQLPSSDLTVKRKFFSTILNWYYANELTKNPKFIINSYLKGINKHQIILKKIKEIIINE